jgi:hypothetical protein
MFPNQTSGVAAHGLLLCGILAACSSGGARPRADAADKSQGDAAVQDRGELGGDIADLSLSPDQGQARGPFGRTGGSFSS